MMLAVIVLVVWAVWLGTRLSLGPLPEWFRRGFWVLVVALLVIPSFLHTTLGDPVLWPMAAGLAIGEVSAQAFWRQQASWRARQAAAAARQASHAQRVAQEERAARRAARKAAEPKDR